MFQISEISDLEQFPHLSHLVSWNGIHAYSVCCPRCAEIIPADVSAVCNCGYSCHLTAVFSADLLAPSIPTIRLFESVRQCASVMDFWQEIELS